MADSILPFEYEGKEIRFVGTIDSPEWVAADIIAVLYPEADKRNYSNYLKKVPSRWKGHKRIMTIKGLQGMATIYEPGLYWLINRSDSPKAQPFQEWICEHVLVQIRKTGKFSVQPDLKELRSDAADRYNFLMALSDPFIKNGMNISLVAAHNLQVCATQYPLLAGDFEAVKQLTAHDETLQIEEALYPPRDIGANMDPPRSSQWVNKALIQAGLQIATDDKDAKYKPTPEGEKYSRLVMNQGKNAGKTVQQLKWFMSVADLITEAN